MNDVEAMASRKVPEEFTAHAIFKEMDVCLEAYEALSDLVIGHPSRTRRFVGNLDSHFFESLAGTVESIKTVLLGGRIADAYTLLRRSNATARYQVYFMLRYEQQDRDQGETGPIDWSDSDGFLKMLEQAAKKGIYIEDIDKWMSGEKTPKVESPSKFGSPTVEPLTFLLPRQKYMDVLDRCNDDVHINFFRNLRANASAIDSRTQMALLEQFADDFRFFFIWHIAYVFAIRPEYMSSSDYIDALDCGLQPAEGSQYWVASFIQELFDEIVTPHRPDVTEFIEHGLKYSMELR